MLNYEYIHPVVDCTPQAAFYAEKTLLPIEKTAGRISSELIMCYPPGIPILAPGERMTQPALDYIKYAKEVGCTLTGTQDEDVDNLYVLK